MSERKFSLRQVLGAVSFVDCGDIVACGVSCDSRTVKPGQLFVALSGASVDGHNCIRSALAAGASAVLVERPQSGIRVPQCVVADSRAAWAVLCMHLAGAPAAAMQLAGVTGTNGKTTTTWLLRSILEAAGRRTGLLGTVEYHDGWQAHPSLLTTPDAEQLARILAQMAEKRTDHCVMEVSSHALHQRRCSALRFAVAAVTNITHDHLDYHGTIDRYLAAKAKMASLLLPNRPLLVGIDDPGCRKMLADIPVNVPVITFGFSEEADLRVTVLDSPSDTVDFCRTCPPEIGASSEGPEAEGPEAEGPEAERPGAEGPPEQPMQLMLRLRQSTLQVSTRLVGRHNALNCLTAAGMAEQLGIPDALIARGLENVACIPGRMEAIRAGQPFQVFVDYAHTPDGLRHCLQTARERTRGRVICVFGAGGDRDRSKRPLMAQASEAADVVLVTSDNPRSEDPRAIIQDIVNGFSKLDRVLQQVDREAAIRRALEMASAEDTVVVAGRGHEPIQQIGAQQICFDDRRVARRLLRELKPTATPSFRNGRLSLVATHGAAAHGATAHGPPALAANSSRSSVVDPSAGSISENAGNFPNRIPA